MILHHTTLLAEVTVVEIQTLLAGRPPEAKHAELGHVQAAMDTHSKNDYVCYVLPGYKDDKLDTVHEISGVARVCL